MRLWKFLIHHWRLTYGVGLIVSVLYLSTVTILKPTIEAETIFYPQIFLREMGLVQLAPTVLLLGCGAFFWGVKRQIMDWRVYGIFIFPLIVILGVWTTDMPSVEANCLRYPVIPIESIALGDHVYKTACGRAEFMVYQCDSLSLICHQLYRLAPIQFRVAFNMDEHDSPSWTKCKKQPELKLDRQKLLFLSFCEVVFSYDLP